MKRGELCGKIRKASAVAVSVPGLGWIVVQKGALINALQTTFPSKSDETDYELDAGGYLRDIEGKRGEPEQLDLEDAIAARVAADDCDDLF